MSRSTVRAQMAGWLTAAAIPGLNKVFPAAPLLITGQDWAPVAPSTAGACAFIHLDLADRTRISLGGPNSGIKKVVYTTSIVVIYRYMISGAEAGDVTAWVDPYETIIDNLVARIEQDRTFGGGATGPIWQAGEGDPNGAPADIRLASDLPTVDSGQAEVWSRIELTVVEMVNT